MSYYPSRNPNFHCDLLKSLEVVRVGETEWGIRDHEQTMVCEEGEVLTFYSREDAETALRVAQALGPIMSKAHWEMKNACAFPQIGKKEE